MNTVVHAAVRRDLQRFTKALEEFPVGSNQRAADLHRAWQNLDYQLYHHHHSEETIFWPALRQVGADESLVGDLSGEHDRMAEAMGRTRTVMSAFTADPSAGNLEQAKAAFAELTEAVETHFEHEERATWSPSRRRSSTLRRCGGQPGRSARHKVRPRRADTWPGSPTALNPAAQGFLMQQIPGPVLFVLSRVLGRSYSRKIATVWQRTST
jgi:hypothetical protein